MTTELLVLGGERVAAAEEKTFDVIEPVTDLCPHRLCPNEGDESGSRGQRWHDLASDLSLVSLHLLLPDALSDDLPAVDRSFGNFRTGGASDPADASKGAAGRALEAFASFSERVQIFDAFQRRQAKAPDDAQLTFAHAHLGEFRLRRLELLEELLALLLEEGDALPQRVV